MRVLQMAGGPRLTVVAVSVPWSMSLQQGIENEPPCKLSPTLSQAVEEQRADPDRDASSSNRPPSLPTRLSFFSSFSLNGAKRMVHFSSRISFVLALNFLSSSFSPAP